MNLITLAEAREELWDKGSVTTSDYAQATAAEKVVWDRRFNRVIQRFFEKMTPARSLRRVDVPIYDGVITLPRNVQGLLGLKLLYANDVAGSPLFIYSRFHEFAESHNLACNGTVISQPLTENAQTFRTPEAGFRLRVKSTAGASQKYTFIGGTDTDDDEYFDKVQLNITNGTTTTSREWNTLPRILKDETEAGCELYSVDDDNVETLIAIHAPAETSPAYQQYTVPDDTDAVSARILTRLCFTKLCGCDVVVPSSYGALQLGLQALRYEDVNDWENSRMAWGEALSLIDSGKEMLEGEAEVPSIRATRGFACSGMPNFI